MPWCDLASTASLLADTYWDAQNPAYCDLFASVPVERQRDAFFWLFSRFLRVFYHRGDNRGLFVGTIAQPTAGLPAGTPVCFFALSEPAIEKISLLEQLRVGLFTIPFVWGTAVFKRMLALPEQLDKYTDDAVRAHAAGRERYLRLERVVVLPALQNNGLGKQLLAVATEQMDAAGLPCALSTQALKNVAFYRKFGWEVASEHELTPPGGGKYTSWEMWREPREAAGGRPTEGTRS